MKLRVRGNSLRLRLTRGEVDALVREGRVEEHVAFAPDPAARLVYAVEARDVAVVAAALAPGEITVVVPVALARTWASSDEVGISREQAVGAEGTLKLLIEKDFTCLVPREGEDGSDAFPHPKASR
jgi:hypothetical protein